MTLDAETTPVAFETQVALIGARLTRLSDRDLAFFAKDASDAIASAIEMGRDGSEPACRRYTAELTAAQDEQNFRARLAAALAS